MEVIKAGKTGGMSPLLQKFPTECLVSDDSLMIPDRATGFGYVIDGSVKVGGHSFEEGDFYLAGPRIPVMTEDGQHVVFIRHGFVSTPVFGGTVSVRGMTRTGVKGVQTTDLVVRHGEGDPLLQAVYINRLNTVEYRPEANPIFGAVMEGRMRCVTGAGTQQLERGDVFALDCFEKFTVLTGDTPVSFIWFHPIGAEI